MTQLPRDDDPRSQHTPDSPPPNDGAPGADWWDAPQKRSSRGPWIGVAVLLCAAMGAAAVFALKALDNAPSATTGVVRDASARATSAPLDPTASKTIGLRARTAGADDVFGKRLTDFTVALDRGQEDSGLIAPDVAASIGEKPATALAAVVSAAKSASNPFSDAEKVATELEIAVAQLDESLLAAGLPYFVDSSVRTTPANKRLVLFYGFSVVATSTLASADASVRTVRVRRLDQLNWRHRLLGMVRENRAQAVVLLDQLDRELVELLLPSLAPNAPMRLTTDETPEDAVVAVRAPANENDGSHHDLHAMADKAGTDLRSELGVLAGVDAAASRVLGEALTARAKIYATWDERFQRAGRRLPLPTKLGVDSARLERDVAPVAERGELEELRRRQKQLDSPEIVRTYETLRDALAFSIEGHEAQHRLDLLRPIPVPRAVDAYAPPLDRPAQNRLRRQIAAELSAYLAQIARDSTMPRTTYTRLAKFATDPAVRGGAESYVALLATEAIARELAVPDVGPLLHDGNVDEERMARAHRALTNVPTAALCAAAARAWQTSFGAPLPTLSVANVEATP